VLRFTYTIGRLLVSFIFFRFFFVAKSLISPWLKLEPPPPQQQHQWLETRLELLVSCLFSVFLDKSCFQLEPRRHRCDDSYERPQAHAVMTTISRQPHEKARMTGSGLGMRQELRKGSRLHEGLRRESQCVSVPGIFIIISFLPTNIIQE
jgi:hypothetical protein